METREIINNAIEIAYDTLGVNFTKCETIEQVTFELSSLLSWLRKRHWMPKSLYDEKSDLERRLERNIINIVSSDSYSENQGGFNNGLRLNTEEKKHIDRLGYIERLKEINKQINDIENDYDVVRDSFKDLIELLPNQVHADIMKQYYVYSKKTRIISQRTCLTVETLKQYRHRGLKALSDIIFENLKENT